MEMLKENQKEEKQEVVFEEEEVIKTTTNAEQPGIGIRINGLWVIGEDNAEEMVYVRRNEGECYWRDGDKKMQRSARTFWDW